MRKVLTKLQKEVRKNMILAISAAFAFLIALVWRDAISEGVDKALDLFNLTNEGFLYKLISALIVTLICVIGITIANHRLKNES